MGSGGSEGGVAPGSEEPEKGLARTARTLGGRWNGGVRGSGHWGASWEGECREGGVPFAVPQVGRVQ